VGFFCLVAGPAGTAINAAGEFTFLAGQPVIGIQDTMLAVRLESELGTLL
jgi:hypothetical protein